MCRPTRLLRRNYDFVHSRLSRPPSFPSPQDNAILAAIAVAAGAALNDAYLNSAKSQLKSIATRAAKAGTVAPAAADEAVGFAAMTCNIIYVLSFAALSQYVLPNFQALVNTPFGVGAPLVSMLLPAGFLAAYGRKLI